MTIARRKPTTGFHAFLVEPEPGFVPRNWRDKPQHYRIVEYLGPKQFRGRADAWRFLHNHEAIQSGQPDRWAIVVE